MKCPVDQTDLMMSDRQGIEIDYCPKCRGVWLDRGELDKIIERSGTVAAAPEAPPPPSSRDDDRRGDRYDRDRDRDRYGRGYDDDDDDRRRPRRRRSFLDDIFDFD